jgi:hypothetical protein
MFRFLRKLFSATALVLLFGGILTSFPKSLAQEIPGGPEASPDIYHVLAENEISRLLLGIWAPDARDEWHGHPPTSVFYVMDCHVRVFFPDGSQRDLQRIAGTGRVRSRPVSKHSVQNIGTEECRIVLTEIKSQE